MSDPYRVFAHTLIRTLSLLSALPFGLVASSVLSAAAAEAVRQSGAETIGAPRLSTDEMYRAALRGIGRSLNGLLEDGVAQDEVSLYMVTLGR